MLSGISITQLLIVLAIVILIFGTRKLRTLGEDVGGGIRGIRDGFGDDSPAEVAREVAAVGKEFKEAQEELKDWPKQWDNFDETR